LSVRNIIAPLFCAIALTIPTLAAAEAPAASSSGEMTSNGSSTGVGNAGSFGIGSGTADGNATATATSNGFVDSSTDNSVDNSFAIKPVALQVLEASTTNNQITISGSPNSTVSTGSNQIAPNTFVNYTGILTNGWNTGQAANAQAATNISVNASINLK
jgi:hypothetical protein